MEQAEKALREVYEPAFYSRVGLRYVDTIVREDLGLAGVSWHKLIKPYFAGLFSSTELGANLQESKSETLVQLDGAENSFVKIRHGFITLEGSDRTAFLLDADFSVQGRLSSDDAYESLAVFNRLARDLFRWSITAELEEALGPQSVDEVVG